VKKFSLMSQTSKPHALNSISEQLGMKTTSALCMSVRMVAGLREKKKGWKSSTQSALLSSIKVVNAGSPQFSLVPAFVCDDLQDISDIADITDIAD